MMKRYDEFFTIVYFFANFTGDAPKKKTVTKVQRWEEKLFRALIYKKGISVDERIVEIMMAYYYQNMVQVELYY